MAQTTTKPLVTVGNHYKVEYEWQTSLFGLIGYWEHRHVTKLSPDLDIQISSNETIGDIFINGKKLDWKYVDLHA